MKPGTNQCVCILNIAHQNNTGGAVRQEFSGLKVGINPRNAIGFMNTAVPVVGSGLGVGFTLAKRIFIKIINLNDDGRIEGVSAGQSDPRTSFPTKTRRAGFFRSVKGVHRKHSRIFSSITEVSVDRYFTCKEIHANNQKYF